MSFPDAVAFKLTASRGGVEETTQYVSPESLRYAFKLLMDECYYFIVDALTELPEGVSLDIE